MSQRFGSSIRRVLRQSPAEFQLRCRADAHRTLGHSGRAFASAKKHSHKKPQDRITQRLPTGLYSRSPVASRVGGEVRPFSTSGCARATTVLQNPRLDDDGKEMNIEISERAAKRLQQITSSTSPSVSGQSVHQHNHLRVSVTSGGCHGFQYLMSLEPSTAIENDVDTIFASKDSPGSAKVVMDEASLELLKGSTVDYTTELIGSQFKIVGNPRAKSSCGCGTSFDVED